jgi:hypothetical protein
MEMVLIEPLIIEDYAPNKLPFFVNVTSRTTVLGAFGDI